MCLELKAVPVDDIEQANKLIWMTEEYPPYNFRHTDGSATGMAVDILLEMCKRTGVSLNKKDIQIIPWARAYKSLVETPNSVIFSMDYTPKRSELFKFVGPIADSIVSIFTLSDQPAINKITDLSAMRVGVVRNDIGQQLLLSKGATRYNMVELPTSFEMIQMLQLQRLDAIALANDIAAYQFKRIGLSEKDYQTHMLLHHSTANFAFNKQVPDSVIKLFQQALDELYQEGVVQVIQQRYLEPSALP